MMLQPIDDSPELTDLEQTVLATALAGNGAGLEELRGQAARAKSAARTPSGVGFMTKLVLPSNVVAATDGTASVPVVYGQHPQLPGGAEFIVEVRDGRLNCIEAFCYEGMWPSDESQFEIATR